jgi:hypothetical protein
MSTAIASIQSSGRNADRELEVTQFAGPAERRHMLQLIVEPRNNYKMMAPQVSTYER